MQQVEKYLDDNNIEYTLHEHPAVYTCEEAEKYCGDIPGLACKNLFLKDKKGSRHFLIVLPATKRADLKQIAVLVGEKKVSFASSDALMEKMNLEPGAVSPFGLINDSQHEIEVFVDSDVHAAAIVSFHPNRNTGTLELTGAMFNNFLNGIENNVNIMK